MKLPNESLQESIVQQREMLTELLHEPLHQLADACSRVWGDRAKMEAVLNEAFPSVPYCKFLYALDTKAIQITSNISRDGLIVEHFGRDRSDRPYMSEALLTTGFMTKTMNNITSNGLTYVRGCRPLIFCYAKPISACERCGLR